MQEGARSDYWDISKLKLWDKNPRSIKDKRFNELKERLKRQGQIKPLLVTKTGVVIGGNMRLRAMQQLGYKNVWVSITNAETDKDIFDLALTDNEEFGYYEQEQLAELASNIGLTELELQSYELVLGEPTTLTDILNQFGPEDEVVEDEAPELDETGEPESKLGEIYKLGRHRVMCGDSTDRANVELLMDGKKADMVFTDPPYGIEFQSNFREKTPQFSKIANDAEILDISPILREHTKGQSVSYICTRWDVYPQWVATLSDFNIKNCVVWYKRGGGLGDLKHSYIPNHEFIIVAHRGVVELQEKRHPDVWEMKRDSFNSYQHPTQKPVELPSFAIRNHSKQDGIILDLFLGSGSTLIACEQTDRTCYGMELDPRYIDVIRKRYAKYIGEEERWQEVTPNVKESSPAPAMTVA